MKASSSFDFTLGVLQCEAKGNLPFSEKMYCQKLSVAGWKYGIRVIVFSPLWVHWHDNTVYAYVLKRSGWERGKFPLPRLVYDRCVYSSFYLNQYRATRAAIDRMKKQAAVVTLSTGLRGKWDTYRTLIGDSFLKSILPPTQLFTGTADLIKQLSLYRGELFLKPHGGTHGQSTLHIRFHPSGKRVNLSATSPSCLELYGRDKTNRYIHQTFPQLQRGLAWIKRFIGKRKFVVQPYLSLVSQEGEPFDIRVLMQKNEMGNWNFIGMAARVGKKGSVTSNLHGGGHAVPVIPFLEKQFEPHQVQHLVQQLRTYSEYIPPLLETQYGRISELGLDFGIDLDAQIWLLEVNSKPGRSIFHRTGNDEAALKSVENPILYARHVLVNTF